MAGIETNEFITQTESGVMKVLEESREYFNYVNDYEDEKTASKYYPWVRPTINWSLACELNGLTRDDAYKLYNEKPINLQPINYRSGLNTAALWFLWMPFVAPCLACLGPLMMSPKSGSSEDAGKIAQYCCIIFVILAYGMCLFVSSSVFKNLLTSRDYIDN